MEFNSIQTRANVNFNTEKLHTFTLYMYEYIFIYIFDNDYCDKMLLTALFFFAINCYNCYNII